MMRVKTRSAREKCKPGPAIVKADEVVLAARQAYAPIRARPAIGRLVMGPQPGALETFGHVGHLRPRHADVDVAPAAGVGQIAPLLAARRRRSRIDDVHAAKKCHAIVDHEQLAMIAAIEDFEERQISQRIEQGMKAMHLDARRFDPGQQLGRRGLAADGVVQDPHVDAGSCPLDQGVGNQAAGRVPRKDIRFEPHARLGRVDVGHHLRNHGGLIRRTASAHGQPPGSRLFPRLPLGWRDCRSACCS